MWLTVLYKIATMAVKNPLTNIHRSKVMGPLDLNAHLKAKSPTFMPRRNRHHPTLLSQKEEKFCEMNIELPPILIQLISWRCWTRMGAAKMLAATNHPPLFWTQPVRGAQA